MKYVVSEAPSITPTVHSAARTCLRQASRAAVIAV